MKRKMPYINHQKMCSRNFVYIERKLNELEQYVFEGRRIERFIFWSVIGFYAYIIFNIFYWIGRTLF